MAFTKKNPSDFEAIVVNGCLIEPNTIYEVVSKEPGTAPEIYREMGTCKERIPGVSNLCTLSQNDTGFFPGSNLFSRDEKLKNNWAAREKKAEEYYRIFAEPMRSYIADIDQIKIPTNDEFFNKNYERGMFSVNIGEGVQFNTDNPVHRFQLYIAIVEGELAMKGKREDDEKELGLRDEMDVYHSDAQFTYISLNNKKSKIEQNNEIEVECTYRFGELIRKDKNLLVGILQYVGVPMLKSATKAELTTAYSNNIKGKRDKMKAFYDVIEKYDKDKVSFKKEIEILERLKTKKGREVIVKDGSTYYMGEIPVGSNPKSIVSTLMKDEELLKTFYNKTEDE